jgi:large subunit ribosomal protein L22
MEATARLSYLHISPRKVRLVAHVIRGMDVNRARLELQTLVKRSSNPLGKLLQSAIQNAVHGLGQDASRLYVKSIHVDVGPTSKRQMARAFGRGATIRKRTSHVALVLGVRGEKDTKRKKTKKKEEQVVRVADWQEVKGEVKENRTGNQERAATPFRKRFGGFGKKVFTRKVI